MASSQISPRFVIFVVVSLLTHLMDVAASGLFCHVLMRNDALKTPWFSIAAGLLIIPVVSLQLISSVYLLRRKGETTSTLDVTMTAVLHVLQLGFVSRHFAILQESSPSSSSSSSASSSSVASKCKKYEISEMLVLRMVFTLTSDLPLLLIKLHVLFLESHEASWDWALYLTSATAVISITWALATYRRHLSGKALDVLLITCPGTVLKIMWRAGEVIARVIALSLFASIYSFWLFLVIGLHWLAMLICVCVPAITPLELSPNGLAYRAFYSFVTSFTYIFVFINTTSENTVFRYTFYYVIFFLENTVLVTVWSVQATSEELATNEVYVYVAAVSFLVAIIAMVVYYKFFHVPTPKESPNSNMAALPVCNSSTCVSCKMNVSTDHPPIPPRPGANGHWLSQYHTALYCGQYCKHNRQDSLLDSNSERNSVLTVSSSHARLQQKLATINDDGDGNARATERHASSCKKTRSGDGTMSNSYLEASITNEQQPQCASSPRSNSKSRKKNKNKKKGDSGTSKKDSQNKKSTKGGGGGAKGGNTSEDSGSQKQPVWLPSEDSNFAKQLMTYSLETFDTNDTADDERSSVATNNAAQDRHHLRREILSREISSVHRHNMDANGNNAAAWAMLKRGDEARHWYSDGYSTDRTLDWPNYPPVTSLAHAQRSAYDPSLDNTTDDDGHHMMSCHECSHGDSEVSSIMRSIDNDVPENGYPTEKRRRSREISPRSPRTPRSARDHTPGDHRTHHHHHHHSNNNHHHHHHHPNSHPNHSNDDQRRHTHRNLQQRQSRNVNSKPNVSEMSNASSASRDKDLDPLNKPTFKSQVSGSNRTHILSSPASDPSHGPKSKRKGSPKRRFHGSAHPDRPSSRDGATNQSNSNPHHNNSTPPTHTSTSEDLILQSELMAKSLLANSSAIGDKSRKHGNKGTSGLSSDPRFNVRVMVSGDTKEGQRVVDVDCDSNNENNRTFSPENRSKLRGENENESGTKPRNVRKKIILGVTEKETDVDRYIPSTEDDIDEGHETLPHSPRDKSSRSGYNNKSNNPPPSETCDDAAHQTQTSSQGDNINNNTRSPTSGSVVVVSAGTTDEIVYENIWQVNNKNKGNNNKTPRHKSGVKNPAFVGDEPLLPKTITMTSPSAISRDAWYMCSESEDSALPPEVLSSSVDGFTASENGSDVSTEIVI